MLFMYTHSMRQYFIAGMVAGLYSTVVYAPVERVKCVMQVCYVQ